MPSHNTRHAAPKKLQRPVALAIAPGHVAPQPSPYLHPPMLLHHMLMLQEVERHGLEDEELDARLHVAGDAFRLGLVREASVYNMVLSPQAAAMKDRVEGPKQLHDIQRRRSDIFRRLWHHIPPQQPSYVHYPVGMHPSLPADYSALCDAIQDFSLHRPLAPPPTAVTSPPDEGGLRGAVSSTHEDEEYEEEDPAINALFERFFGGTSPTHHEKQQRPYDADDVTPPSDRMRRICEAVKKPEAPSNSKRELKTQRRSKLKFDRSGERLSLPNIHLISPRGKREESSFNNSDTQLDDEKLFKQYMRRLEARIRTLGAPSQPSPRPAVDPLGGAGPRPSVFHPSPRQPSIVLM